MIDTQAEVEVSKGDGQERECYAYICSPGDCPLPPKWIMTDRQGSFPLCDPHKDEWESWAPLLSLLPYTVRPL
jgi:hypothetical protein